MNEARIKKGDFVRAMSEITTFAWTAGLNKDGIDEIGIRLAETTEDQDLIEVYYSNLDAPYPPRCAEQIAERFSSIGLSHVPVEYIKASPAELSQ